MRNYHTHILSFFVLSVALFSCKDCPCIKAQLKFDLIGFSDSEADTIILRRFDLNGNFNLLKDSFLLHNNRYTRLNDTLKLVAYTGDALLESNYNYEIFFPATGSLYRIFEINEPISYQNCGGIFATDKVACENVITSCNLNGVVTPVYFFNYFYIHK